MYFKRLLFLFYVVVFFIFTGCSGKDTFPDNAAAKAERQEKTQNVIKENVYVENQNFGGLTAEKAKEKLEQMAKAKDVLPVDAKIDESTWNVMEKEQKGNKIDTASMLSRLEQAAAGEKVELVQKEENPQIISGNIKSIGKFSTEILDNAEERVNNIVIACEYLSGTVMEPGEEFSFNDTLGKRTEEKGYEKAIILIKIGDETKREYGVGGGICQVSTTMYNALLAAGLEVTERHPHTKEIPYIEKGKDATVVYGAEDLKFVNNKDSRIMIKAFVEDNKVFIEIIENKNKK